MDDLRKKNLKSIVARKLVLFNALEKGRPRSSNGSPLLYPNSHDQFIFNSGLSSSIILDIKKTQQKKKLKADNSVYETCSLVANMADGNPDVGSAMQGESDLESTTNDIPRCITYSVRHLRSLFENTDIKQLTARNSLERNARLASSATASLAQISEVDELSSNGKNEQDPVFSATEDECSKTRKENISTAEESATTKGQSCTTSQGALATQEEKIENQEAITVLLGDTIESHEESVNAQEKSVKKQALLPPKPGMVTPAKALPPSKPSPPQLPLSKHSPPQLPLSKHSPPQLPPSKPPPSPVPLHKPPPPHMPLSKPPPPQLPPSKPPPSPVPLHKPPPPHPPLSKPPPSQVPPSIPEPLGPLPSKQQETGEEKSNLNSNEYENYNPNLARKEAIMSVYVDPSFKVPEKTYDPCIKGTTLKRTLGRGEIKPYEIVDLVQKEYKGEVSQPQRMESMYVETFGGKSSSFDADGYQTIPEYSEPTVEGNPDLALDKDEFDLSNLNNPDSEEGSVSPTIPETSSGEGYFGKVNMKAVHLDSSVNSNCLSMSSHSDCYEGWDSDEFDYYTDDDVLEETRPRSKTCDGDVGKKKILNIVNEILTTEKTYEKRLHLLDQVFQARLMKEAKENSLIPEKVIQEIFSNLSSIYIFHSTMLLPDLEKRISNWSANEKIGDIFKTLGHCLKLYTDYVKNFDHATSTLNQWMKKSPKFASIIEEIQKLPECEHLSLQHHMLGPIQRVPRYKLLLKDYLKKLPEDASDRAEAQESLVVISEAADHANNSMKGMDKFKKLVELEERIVEGLNGESLATASRLFIKEGELVKIAARSDQKNVRVLLLFNDLLLCCHKVAATGKLKVKQMMEIAGMTLQDNEDIDLGEPHAFRVKSRQRVLDLAATNGEEKNEWMAAISGVIEDYEAKRGSLLKQFMEEDARKEAEKSNSMKMGQSAPVWVKDEDVTMCMLCAVRFSLLSRRHHCRSCGRIVCDNCSKYKAQLAYVNNNVKRVCYVCHRKLNVDKIQATDSYILKKTTIDRVARDPKRRRSTLVSEVKGDLMWKAPGRKWEKGWFAISDLVLYAHKGRKDPKAQMTIALPGYTVSRPAALDDIDEGKHPFVFKVHFASKKEMTYFFQAEDETKMERWIDVISYSVKAEKPPWSKTL